MILLPCLEHENSFPFWDVITETSFLFINSINLYGAVGQVPGSVAGHKQRLKKKMKQKSLHPQNQIITIYM